MTITVPSRRAVAHPNDDGTAEVSGIVSDVTERRRMRADLAQAHAAMSHVVDAMDAHLFTLRIDGDGGHRAVYRGPNREALVGGRLPAGGDDEAAYDALIHPADRERRRDAIEFAPAGIRPPRNRASASPEACSMSAPSGAMTPAKTCSSKRRRIPSSSAACGA